MSTTDQCAVKQDLCPFYRGDSVPFEFTFKDSEGTVFDITNYQLTFTMKLDANSDSLGNNDLQKIITFPDNSESQAGNGYMKLLPDDTKDLLVERTYHYDFELKTTNDDIFTVGAGTVKVLNDITK